MDPIQIARTNAHDGMLSVDSLLVVASIAIAAVALGSLVAAVREHRARQRDRERRAARRMAELAAAAAEIRGQARPQPQPPGASVEGEMRGSER